MGHSQTSREKPAPANLLSFPERHEHRPVQADIGMGSAGFLSLMLLDRDGQLHPANVQRFDEPDGPTLPSQTPELLLALLVWQQLPSKKKENVSRSLGALAYSNKPDGSAIKLLNLLRGRI